MPSHKKQATTAPSTASPKFAEDWSPRGFYKTMLFLFRNRPDPNTQKPIPLPPPFYLNRPLTQEEWQACSRQYAAHYAQRLFTKSQEAWTRTPSQKKAKPTKTKPDNTQGLEILDDLLHDGPQTRWPGLSWSDRWKYYKAVGQFLFANSKPVQQAARKRLKELAMTATATTLRTALSQVAHTRIQVKNRFPLIQPPPGGPTSIYDIRLYHGERQFLWAFLRKEAGSPQKASKAERQEIADRISSKLIKDEHYPYLKMNAETISKGLVNPRQADHDTAEKFQCSPTAIRSLLSKSLKF